MAKILIADDDLFYRQLVQGWLTDMGHQVTAVQNGQEAIAAWETADPPYQCFVLDVYMEGKSGIEVLQGIREKAAMEDNRKRRAPVIIMTSDDSIETEVRAREKKAFSFLIKPFGQEELEQVIHSALQITTPRAGTRS